MGHKWNRSFADRFWSKVDKTDSCWLWTGAVNDHGYGQVYVNGKLAYAHRVALVLSGRQVPPGMFACHHCDTPNCVRPDHLFIGTNADNMRDCANKGRAENMHTKNPKRRCIRGHVFSDIDSRGWQRCRICRAESARRRRAIGRKS